MGRVDLHLRPQSTVQVCSARHTINHPCPLPPGIAGPLGPLPRHTAQLPLPPLGMNVL